MSPTFDNPEIAPGATPERAAADAVFDVLRPERVTTPVVFASPHSGRRYPPGFLASSGLDDKAIRRSEDAFIDEIFACVTDFGAPLLRAHFPRAYVDANREPFELDPAMFAVPLPDWVNTTSPRVAAGLGTVAKIVAGGAEIYARPLDFDEVSARIRTCYEPYHQALRALIDDAVTAFGCCLVIDCHSMPSMIPVGHQAQADIVLGDCHGSTCARDVSLSTERALRNLGLSVNRNKPYAGGFTTRNYARTLEGVQTLQIEINRALYMDESTIRPNAGYARLAERMRILVAHLTSLDPSVLAPAWAAE
jgi:N-formylglutamate amidohydrolase